MTKPSIDQNRKTITTLWANGTHDAYTIHELTSISLSTIYNYIKKLENGESLDHKPRSGRPENFLHSSVQNCYTGPQTAQISTRLRIYGKF